MRSLAIALGLALFAGAATAQLRPSIITMPDWAEKPTGEDMAALYPPEAVKSGLEGRATIGCVTTAEGLLADCQVVAEDPPGAGFGDAAVALAAKFRMQPMTKDGQAVAGGKVRIPIVFRLPAPASAPAAASGQPQGNIRPPDWTRRPTGRDVERLYPREALRRRITGKAVIRCGVTDEGELRDCKAIEETPPGFGFGDAALKMAPIFKMRPMTSDERAVGGGVVTIPIVFRFPT